MFALPTSFRVLLALDPVDTRTHLDGLWALAVQRLGTDPKSGTICVFANRNRDRVKLQLPLELAQASAPEPAKRQFPTGSEDALIHPDFPMTLDLRRDS